MIIREEMRSALIEIGKNTLSISDLSSEKNVYNVPISGKNETADHQCGKKEFSLEDLRMYFE